VVDGGVGEPFAVGVLLAVGIDLGADKNGTLSDRTNFRCGKSRR
jgi:hypothetical protein